MGRAMKSKVTKNKTLANRTQILKRSTGKARFGTGALGSALKAALKIESNRTELTFSAASKAATSTMFDVPIEERAGYPVKREKGSVDPADWVAGDHRQQKTGGAWGKPVKITVDFSRHKWLPDTWGQGVKITRPTAHTKAEGSLGGTYTVMIAPDGKVFYHRGPAEEYAGYKFSEKLGFNGQLRKAQLQAQQAVQVARREMKNMQGDASGSKLGFDRDTSLFKVLSAAERKHILDKKQFHFAVISARRATKPEGIRDVFMVQQQLVEAGVTPTWYVDEESLQDYRRLGVVAVAGGKLTAARNKALKDAKRAGKICVQISDDISAWEYRDGPNATTKTDAALNEAHDNARRLIVSPLSAAQFILAKMRGAPEAKKPKLGGGYMLGSCARTFGSSPFSRFNFILGDFFVVDTGSNVTFDENMKLKEDYDFTASHIKSHGSVMRCNRLTLRVKHYSNSGGAVAIRDKKGGEERRNIAILKAKHPRGFRNHPRRKNEVVLAWPKDERKCLGNEGDEDEDLDAEEESGRLDSSKVKASTKVRVGVSRKKKFVLPLVKAPKRRTK